MKTNNFYTAAILILIFNIAAVQSLEKNPFKHVITLMMENHSYDNLLGFLEAPYGTLNEEKYCNWYDGEIYCTQKGAKFQTEPDPPHQFYPVQYQVFNTTEYPTGNQGEANMGGFAYQYGHVVNGDPQNVMNGYTEEQVPVISKLAKEFVLYDRWFASVPSQTNPNKLFLHAASSGGNTANCGYWFCSTWPINLPTIYDNLQKEGYDYAIHYHDWCEAMAISPLRYNYQNFHYDQNFDKFFDKLENGGLEDYTYLVPRIHWDEIPENENIYNFHKYAPNTQHPSEDVRSGENLLKEIYEKFRQSQYWEDTLLLVVYDEHGGFFDHVTPPQNVTNPSPQDEPTSPFEFNRLGIRVPAIAISPWLKKTVVSNQMEHAAVPHTVHDIFNLKSDYLNKRDEEAGAFIWDDLILDEMREDCPEELPSPPSFDEEPLKISQAKINGTPKTEAWVMGTILVKEGMLGKEIYKVIIDNIHTDAEAIQFVKEAQIILGYRPQQGLQFKYLSGVLGIEQRKQEQKFITE